MRAHFETILGLAELLSGVCRYVKDWVSLLCHSLDITREELHTIHVPGKELETLRNNILEALGLQASSQSLHEIIYPHTQAPCRHLVGGVFLTDDEIRPIFRQPFVLGSPRVPSMLIPKANALHMALRRSLLPRIGYGGDHQLATVVDSIYTHSLAL